MFERVHARSYTRKPISHKINKLRKKTIPYSLRKNISFTAPVAKNTDVNVITTHDAEAEYGVASWYGKQSRRHRTSSGNRLDNQNLTAAHPTLPFGSKVLVRSEETGNSVIVTINDRGPFSKHRIIDLSRAAAAKIGMLHKGTAHVTVTPINPTEVAETPQ